MAQAQPADKFRRYRARRRAEGLKEVRLWVADPEAPGFREDIARQVALLDAAEDEADVMAWVEATWTEIEAETAAAEKAAGVPHPWTGER